MARMSAMLLTVICAQGCGSSLPARPSPAPVPAALTLEAEAGGGQGDRMTRLSASGGATVHLAPGQRREWTLTLPVAAADYAVVVRYGNDETGGSETLTATMDGLPIGSFHARDTGDDGAGWETFVMDSAGVARGLTGRHVLALQSSGGDGCIEIDVVILQPDPAGA
jgi:hypothetical protein